MNIYVNTRLLATTDQSGITVYIKELYSRLLKIDKSNTFYFFQPKGKIFFENTQTFFLLPSLIGNFLFDFIYPLFIFDKSSKKKLYHATTNVLPIIKPKNTKYILTVYDLSFKINKQVYPLIYQLYFDIMLKHSLKIADEIITISENTKKDIIKYYNIPADKITNIYISGSDEFEKINTDRRKIKDPYMLVLAGHPTRKNIKGLLEAYSRCNSKDKLKLVIAGKIHTENLKKLSDFIKSLEISENIIITGFLPFKELKNLYANCEFFVYPAFYEVFGIPVLEATKSNKLVLLSNTSSMTELLPKDYIFYFNPYDINDIKENIDKAYLLEKNKKNKIIKKSNEYIKKFSWDICAKETLKFFKNITNAK